MNQILSLAGMLVKLELDPVTLDRKPSLVNCNINEIILYDADQTN